MGRGEIDLSLPFLCLVQNHSAPYRPIPPLCYDTQRQIPSDKSAPSFVPFFASRI